LQTVVEPDTKVPPAQAEQATAPTPENWPEAHTVQLVAPVVIWFVPAEHDVQKVDFEAAAYLPAAQLVQEL